MSTILVTGANGFVGRRFIQRMKLELNGDVVLAPNSQELNLKDPSRVEEFFEKHHIDIIVHLAAIHGGVGLALNQSLKLFEENLLINYYIVKTAIQKNVKKFITFGSSCSYGQNICLPIVEDDLWKDIPENSYGVCKLVMLEHLKNQNSMNWVYFIPTNIYGFGDHFGEKNMHIIPENILKFESAIKSGYKYIEAWGDGSQIRDFIYVDDVISILMDSIISNKYNNDYFNLSTGREVTIKYVLQMIRKYMDAENIEIRWDTSKPTGMLRKVSDNAKLRNLSPEIDFTGIEEGIMKTVQEYRESLHGEEIC